MQIKNPEMTMSRMIHSYSIKMLKKKLVWPNRLISIKRKLKLVIKYSKLCQEVNFVLK